MTYTDVVYKPLKATVLEAKISDILDHCAEKGITIHYEDLGKKLKLLPRHRSVAKALGNLMREDVRNERPIRSSLVIRKDTGIPGRGYYYVARQLGFTVPYSEEGKDKFVKDRQTEVFKYY